MFPSHKVCIPTVLNNVPYCEHERDICHVCCQTPEQAMATRFFKLPETGQPQYPPSLAQIQDPRSRRLLGKRWLDMQEAVFSAQKPLRAGTIKLPCAATRMGAPPAEVRAYLLQRFQQLHDMAAGQRYYYATQANILLDEYDTFAQATVLYEKELMDIVDCSARLYGVDRSAWYGKASISTILGYFVGLEVQRTFWHIMEMTMEAFVKYLENYDETLDSHVIVEEKAKDCLLLCVAHVFWSLQHAQYCLDNLRRQQHVNFLHNGGFPFYPNRDLDVLEAGLDVHVLIAKLSTAPVFNIPVYASLFYAFRKANDFREQMQGVNVEIMTAIDELSTRFRVMELLIFAAAMVATDKEIKTAIAMFKFDSQSEEVTTITEDLSRLNGLGRRIALPTQNLSLLQTLLRTAAQTRRKNLASFMCGSLLPSEPRVPTNAEPMGLTNEVFDAFKTKYTRLYHGTVRSEFQKHECSLLPKHDVQRFQHRKEVAKKKKQQQQRLVVQDRAGADIAEDRAVPKAAPVNADLFWEVGDGSMEKYVPLPVREKIKTRAQRDSTRPSSEGSQVSTPRSITDKSSLEADEGSPVVRAVKESGLRVRDILWRKVKGSLKWSSFVQFLTGLGCKVLNLDGSKKKVVDHLTGRCTVLHRPHPGDDCRPDQCDSYRYHLEDWLNIHYTHVVPAKGEVTAVSQSPAATV
eukprot:c16489_g1_i1 orf=177-2243(+)